MQPPGEQQGPVRPTSQWHLGLAQAPLYPQRSWDATKGAGLLAATLFSHRVLSPLRLS